ncbi:hypothetical protein, partial [Methanohalobium sp.]|uniref:hypothetical protein n=1 Tax=Methanohalobium sp. TaxID=2837493 RepID=UPI0025E0A22E
MTYNYTSSKAVIAKTYRDLKVQRNDWINDAVEWIGEAMDAIKAYPQLVDRSTRLKTSSHKAPLPHDLHKIKEVRYGLGNGEKTSKPPREDFTRVMEYGDSSNHPSLVDENPNASNTAEHNRESFILEPGYIKTSFDSDWILITYLAFALDDDNFPMVPDDYSHKQALYWYIVLKMVEGGKEHPAGLKYPQVEKRWLKYCNQARNSAKMP